MKEKKEKNLFSIFGSYHLNKCKDKEIMSLRFTHNDKYIHIYINIEKIYLRKFMQIVSTFKLWIWEIQKINKYTWYIKLPKNAFV